MKEGDVAVCSLQTTPATSIREETFPILVRMTVCLLSGRILNVLQHAERDVAVGFAQVYSSAASGLRDNVVHSIRLRSSTSHA